MIPYEELKQCLTIEVIGTATNKKFSWLRVIRRYYRNRKIRYIFWWRIANYLYKKGGKNCIKLAESINYRITNKWGTEIELGAQIDSGITFAHHNGIVISRISVIGKNFHIRQNTTIGSVGNRPDKIIKIGDNVEIGANSCIIGEKLTIGNNVIIGAMSFINKDLPDNCTCYTKKINEIKIRQCDIGPSAKQICW
ncbi:serine acetyltransferase [Xenorhabdus bovienii]|uniref:serine acetyltransferase n=1 Tax=Xenorhabdus bovienii TaxID=40576 RepID=UPI00237CEE23|nr:serine acetyltransferase [Xenorhabdus bovienii]MDE1483393.1 serine acetyltransferase [Xenorhabdus bovienii]MDE9433999.1 serine acetyltransferase [Xenorhabdus bovienii]MDE9437929.1 serine acetyltransferase [Xenorhabdus bovienii]MDE9442474.1 serine acetyltransferase [Xenorhabdus bovienii]MDE9491625.1 serine acetyltransferase [Xenorhabdus bovienii]